MKKFTLPVLYLLSFVIGGVALAQGTQWIYFKSKTDLFEIRLYDNVEEDIHKFRISDRAVVQYGQTVSTFDQRAYKDVVKNYIMKYEQTLGYLLTAQNAARLIDKELELYIDYYTNLGGVLRSKKEAFYKYGFPAGEVYIRYKDPELGEQSIRITVIYTETSKLQHIISGPDDMMTSYKTRQHIESLVIKNGYAQERGSIQEEWRPITSPLRLFTVYLPEPGSPYFQQDYTASNSERIERISTVFHDPIWNQDVYYNVYGYIPNGIVNDARAQSITTEKHIKRHRLNADGLKFKHLMTPGDKPVAEISYDIIAPKGKPHLKWVKLRTTYEDNKLIVHELLGPRHLVESPFFDYLISNVKFHPHLHLTAAEAEKLKTAEDKAKSIVDPELDGDIDEEDAQGNTDKKETGPDAG